MASNPAALTDSILENAAPSIARDYVSLVLGSDDPKVKKEYFELLAKRKEKGLAGGGVTLNVTFDLSGTAGVEIKAHDSPEVIEADDLRPAAPALPPPDDDDEVIDLALLLGIPEAQR